MHRLEVLRRGKNYLLLFHTDSGVFQFFVERDTFTWESEGVIRTSEAKTDSVRVLCIYRSVCKHLKQLIYDCAVQKSLGGRKT